MCTWLCPVLWCLAVVTFLSTHRVFFFGPIVGHRHNHGVQKLASTAAAKAPPPHPIRGTTGRRIHLLVAAHTHMRAPQLVRHHDSPTATRRRHTHTHTRTRTHIHPHTRPLAHTHIHTHTHTHVVSGRVCAYVHEPGVCGAGWWGGSCGGKELGGQGGACECEAGGGETSTAPP